MHTIVKVCGVFLVRFRAPLHKWKLIETAAYTLQFINQTHRSVFLTGKAGTGKTTERLFKPAQEYGCCGPAGIPRHLASGVYDSLVFQLPFGFIPIIHLQFSLKLLNLKPKLLCVGISK
jgi:hypothetical protein